MRRATTIWTAAIAALGFAAGAMPTSAQQRWRDYRYDEIFPHYDDEAQLRALRRLGAPGTDPLPYPDPDEVVHERGDFLDGDYNWWDDYGVSDFGHYADAYRDDDWYYDYYSFDGPLPGPGGVISYRDYYNFDGDPYEDYQDTIGGQISARRTPREMDDRLLDREVAAAAYHPGQTRTVEGEVLRSKLVDLRGTPAREQVVLNATDRGEQFFVDLGQAPDLPSGVQIGDRVLVNGRQTKVGRFFTLLATMVTVDGRTRIIERPFPIDRARERQDVARQPGR